MDDLPIRWSRILYKTDDLENVLHYLLLRGVTMRFSFSVASLQPHTINSLIVRWAWNGRRRNRNRFWYFSALFFGLIGVFYYPIKNSTKNKNALSNKRKKS